MFIPFSKEGRGAAESVLPMMPLTTAQVELLQQARERMASPAMSNLPLNHRV